MSTDHSSHAIVEENTSYQSRISSRRNSTTGIAMQEEGGPGGSRGSCFHKVRKDVDGINAQWSQRIHEESHQGNTNTAVNYNNNNNNNNNVRDGDVGGADLLDALRAKEREAHAANQSLKRLEEKHQQQVTALQQQLREEEALRLKAEQSADEATEYFLKNKINNTTNNSSNTNDSSNAAATAGSDYYFWQKMKEREDTARARVRREFIQEAQTKLYAEQDRREGAEKLAEEAVRHQHAAEARLVTMQAAHASTLAALEELKAQLGESQVQCHQLQAQLCHAEKEAQQSKESLRREVELLTAQNKELTSLAANRESALEAQRAFTQQLVDALGIKDRDLLDKSAAHDSVMHRITTLQDSTRRVEAQCERRLQDAEAASAHALQELKGQLELSERQCRAFQTRCENAERSEKQRSTSEQRELGDALSERDRLQQQLLEIKVEHRSMAIQLEQLRIAARRSSTDASAWKDASRMEQESTLRRRAAEVTALREQLDAEHKLRQQEKASHLHEVLTLSEELTDLKDAHLRLTYAVRYLESDKHHLSCRLSSQSGQRDVSSASVSAGAGGVGIGGIGGQRYSSSYQRHHHHEELQSSQSFTTHDSDSSPLLSHANRVVSTDKTNSNTSNHSNHNQQGTDGELAALRQRVAELEAVRVDLRQKLFYANEQLQQYNEDGIRSSSISSGLGGGGSSGAPMLGRRGPRVPHSGSTPLPSGAAGKADDVGDFNILTSRRAHLQQQVATLQSQSQSLQDELKHLQDAKQKLSVSSSLPARSKTNALSTSGAISASGVYEALTHLICVLETFNISQHHHHAQLQTSTPPSRMPTDDGSPTDKADLYLRHGERDALQLVYASCLASLDCLQGNRSNSPYAMNCHAAAAAAAAMDGGRGGGGYLHSAAASDRSPSCMSANNNVVDEIPHTALPILNSTNANNPIMSNHNHNHNHNNNNNNNNNSYHSPEEYEIARNDREEVESEPYWEGSDPSAESPIPHAPSQLLYSIPVGGGGGGTEEEEERALERVAALTPPSPTRGIFDSLKLVVSVEALDRRSNSRNYNNTNINNHTDNIIIATAEEGGGEGRSGGVLLMDKSFDIHTRPDGCPAEPCGSLR